MEFKNRQNGSAVMVVRIEVLLGMTQRRQLGAGNVLSQSGDGSMGVRMKI